MSLTVELVRTIASGLKFLMVEMQTTEAYKCGRICLSMEGVQAGGPNSEIPVIPAEASFVDTPIRISISTSTPHELATTIINDLVFKCILRSMDDLEMSLPRNKSLDKIIVDQICLLVKVMGLICKALPMFVEGVYNIGPKDIVGECTKVEFIEGCYVKEIKKPELRPKPSYLSVAKGISEQQGPWRHSYDGY